MMRHSRGERVRVSRGVKCELVGNFGFHLPATLGEVLVALEGDAPLVHVHGLVLQLGVIDAAVQQAELRRPGGSDEAVLVPLRGEEFLQDPVVRLLRAKQEVFKRRGV
eukprot:1181018-Prorocentrum_minimum.AAC.4